MIAEFIIHYHVANKDKIGSYEFENDGGSILTTIKVLALIQHYTSDLNEEFCSMTKVKKSYVATPMLDCTRDLRVAASFAIMGRGKEKQGVVRHILVDSPVAIDIKKNNHPYWNQADIGVSPELPRLGVYVQRLGDSDMLLVDLASILPPSSWRPLNQSGYLIVHEADLIDFHKLRLDVEQKWGTDGKRNVETIPELIRVLRYDENLGRQMEAYVRRLREHELEANAPYEVWPLGWRDVVMILFRDVIMLFLDPYILLRKFRMRTFVGGSSTLPELRSSSWDALSWNVLDVEISDDIAASNFFHEADGRIGNQFSQLLHEQLYPGDDRMMKLMKYAAECTQGQMEKNGGWWE